MKPNACARVEQLFRSVDEAAEMGVNRVGFLSGIDPGEADRPKALDALAKSVKQVAAYAQDKGIQLVLETFDYDIDKKCLIGPNPLAAEFCRRIRQDFPGFGLLCDLSHVPLQHETSAFALNQLKDCLVHIHVGNCVLDPKLPGYGDLHPRFGWPGGVNDVPELAEFIRALFAVGYLAEGRPEKPWVGFEVKPQSPDEILRNGDCRGQTRLERSLGAGLIASQAAGRKKLTDKEKTMDPDLDRLILGRYAEVSQQFGQWEKIKDSKSTTLSM